MPQKNRARRPGKQGRPSAVVDALSTEDMSKEQLEEHIVRLREELDREREERSYFQLERDKIQALWEILRRSLEETEAQLRNNVRERDEAAERHRVEITVYKQKLKHVLSEQHNAVAEAKTDAVSSSTLLQNRNAESELGLRREVQEVQRERRERKLLLHKAEQQLRLKHQEELLKLRDDYERRILDLETRFHQQMRSLMEAEKKRRRAAVREVEEQMRIRVESVKEENVRSLRKGEEYFSRIQESLQEERERWKERLEEAQRQKQRVEKEASAAQQENRRLQEELQEAQQKLPELQQRLQEHQSCKEQLEKRRAERRRVDQELRELTVEHQLLLDAFQKLQEERDELLRSQTRSLQDVQRRRSLKKLLLQRKLEALTAALEQKEAGLCAADPHAAAARPEEMLESKRSAVEELQQEGEAGPEPDRTGPDRSADPQ